MFPKIIFTCCSDTTATKLAYAHTAPNSLRGVCKHSTRFLFLKKIYIRTDGRTQSLSCSSIRGPQILDDEGNSSSFPLPERDGDEGSRQALAAPTRSSARTSAVPAGRPSPSRPGVHTGGPRGPTDA